MTGKCKLSECPAPEASCHLGKDHYTECDQFSAEIKGSKNKNEVVLNDTSMKVYWNGQSISTDDIGTITSRSNTILVGIVGRADAGKTTFLAMVYTLLLGGGKLSDFNFAGSRTIIGWEELYHRLKLKNGNVPFPQPTPVTSNRLYHLALRNSERQLKDVLFADASGEVFSSWSVNRNDDNVANARWVYEHSDAFILFIDCDALALRKNAEKSEVMLLARQLTHELKCRPVITVWSKADKMKDVLPKIRETIRDELKMIFINYHEIEISNFLEPGPDELVHKNNLKVVDWVLNQSQLQSTPELCLENTESEDLFINYRG